MHRWLAGSMLTVVVLTGCKDAFRARPEVVAEAAGQELKIEHLGKLLAGIKSVPISKEAADLVINMWVDHTLFAQAIASGRTLQDSATAAAVLWPEISEMVGSEWHDKLIASKVSAGPDQADSAYNVGDVRLLQHILIRIPPNSEPPVIAAAKKKIEMIQGRVNRGENFEKLAKEFSEDPGSASNGGYYPPSPRGKFVTAFDSAGWSLAPGAKTGIIETPYGYHIIRRPAPAEVRPQMIEYVRARVGTTLDSIYLQSLGEKHGLKVEKGAVALMRKAVSERDKAIVSQDALAKYDTGKLTVSDFMRWVSALGPDWAVKLTSQPDTMLVSFVKLIAQNQLLLKQADSAGVRVTAEEWAAMSTAYASQVDSLRMLLHITESDLGDAAASSSDRQRAAALKVSSYWDALASGTAERPRPVPAQLGMLLRQTEPHEINSAAIAQALELAHALKEKNDPTGAGGPAGGLPPGVPVIQAPVGGAPR